MKLTHITDFGKTTLVYRKQKHIYCKHDFSGTMRVPKIPLKIRCNSYIFKTQLLTVNFSELLLFHLIV